MIAISYRRDDSLPIAGRLYDRLQAKFGKRNVFMDFDSIPAGVDFREQIKQTIERAHLVIAVIGPDWLGEQGGSRRIDDPADFVRLEIAYALNRGIPVIPLLVDETPMPKAEKLPPDIAALAYRNALPLDSGIDFHSHTDRLIVGIRRALSGARPRTQTNVSDSGQSAAAWGDRRRTIAIWCGSILVCSLAVFALWRFVASGSTERTERERTVENDKTLAATATPHSSPAPSPPPVSPEQSKSIPAQLPEAQASRTPQPATKTAPTPEPTLESRLMGKWQGPRHMIEYFPDHTFAQTGLKVDGMTWRLEGHVLTIVYPDLGKDFPAWYPEPGPLTLKIVSLTGGELITENGAGLQFVEYRITVDAPDEREGAATRAKAETKKRQANQSERPSPTATRAPQSNAVPTIQASAAPTASSVVETSQSQTPVTQPSNEKLARVYVAKIGLNVLLPTAFFPDAAARLADEKTDHLNSVQGCADVVFRASRDSVKNVYETCIKEVAPQGSGKSIDYKVLKPTWFVVSGSSRRSGFYIKGVKHGNEVAVMQLEYIGTLCNIPAPVLAEISQKFDGNESPVPNATASPAKSIQRPMGDAELSRQLAGSWRSSRHKTTYQLDGTWTMGQMKGRWRIESGKLITTWRPLIVVNGVLKEASSDAVVVDEIIELSASTLRCRTLSRNIPGQDDMSYLHEEWTMTRAR